MKNSADQGGCYPQRPKAEVDNTLRDLQNSSYLLQYDKVLSKFGQQELVIVNYACGFNQPETGKYLE